MTFTINFKKIRRVMTPTLVIISVFEISVFVGDEGLERETTESLGKWVLNLVFYLWPLLPYAWEVSVFICVSALLTRVFLPHWSWNFRPTINDGATSFFKLVRWETMGVLSHTRGNSFLFFFFLLILVLWQCIIFSNLFLSAMGWWKGYSYYLWFEGTPWVMWVLFL